MQAPFACQQHVCACQVPQEQPALEAEEATLKLRSKTAPLPPFFAHHLPTIWPDQMSKQSAPEEILQPFFFAAKSLLCSLFCIHEEERPVCREQKVPQEQHTKRTIAPTGRGVQFAIYHQEQRRAKATLSAAQNQLRFAHFGARLFASWAHFIMQPSSLVSPLFSRFHASLFAA